MKEDVKLLLSQGYLVGNDIVKLLEDPFNDIPEMGRFVLEKEGRPAAGGIIL